MADFGCSCLDLPRFIKTKFSDYSGLFVCFWRDNPPVVQGHPNDAPQSVGLLWTSDQLVAETST